MATICRPERDGDHDAVRAVHRAAFPTDAEGRLVDALRADAWVNHVAERDGQVVAHVLFSEVTHSGPSETRLAGLAPVAVAPDAQRQGIGGALIRGALNALDADAVVVLGDPAYYPRFGFAPAARFGLRSEYDAGDAFMTMEMRPGALDAVEGLVRYHPAFGALA